MEKKTKEKPNNLFLIQKKQYKLQIFKFKISQYKKIDKKTNLFIWN